MTDLDTLSYRPVRPVNCIILGFAEDFPWMVSTRFVGALREPRAANEETPTSDHNAGVKFCLLLRMLSQEAGVRRSAAFLQICGVGTLLSLFRRNTVHVLGESILCT